MSGVRVSHLGPQPLKSNDFRGCFLTSNFIISSKLTTLIYQSVIFDFSLYFLLNCIIINVEKLSNYIYNNKTMAGNSTWFYESFRRENSMGVNQYVEFNKFKVFSKGEKNSFLHVDLSDDVSFYRGFVKYFLDETRLLRYAENKANLEFSPNRRNYVTLFKHLSHYLDDYNQETPPREIEEDVFRILTDEYQLNDPGDGNLHVRLDKIGKLGEYIFCNLLSEYFGFDCIIPKVHLTTDFNMSVFGIDTLFYSSKNNLILFGESKFSKSLANGIGLINKSLKSYEKQIRDEFILMLSKHRCTRGTNKIK